MGRVGVSPALETDVASMCSASAGRVHMHATPAEQPLLLEMQGQTHRADMHTLAARTSPWTLGMVWEAVDRCDISRSVFEREYVLLKSPPLSFAACFAISKNLLPPVSLACRRLPTESCAPGIGASV